KRKILWITEAASIFVPRTPNSLRFEDRDHTFPTSYLPQHLSTSTDQVETEVPSLGTFYMISL
ncbi:hypothetical protein LEMLEM_LOCUS5505, partial [Lemmus lemmus]